MRPVSAYHFGSPAGPEHFADRRAELDFLAGHMGRGSNVIVHAPRRYGKTSLLRRAVEEARVAGCGVGYANLLRCSTRREVAEAVMRAIFAQALTRRGGATRVARLIERVRVRPRLEVRADGSLRIELEAGLADQDWAGAMADAARVADESAARRPVSLVLDEFQQVAEVDRALAGVFKAILDETGQLSWVLAGSHVHLMERLTTRPGAALLGMGELLRLGPVPGAEMAAYLVERAGACGKVMSEDVAGALIALAGPVPNDIQRLAQHAFDAAAGADLDADAVAAGLDLAIARQATTFAERYERLGPGAQRLLRLAAAEPLERPYSRAVLTRLELANDNSVRTALRSLEESELVVRRDGRWEVADPFLARWLTGPEG